MRPSFLGVAFGATKDPGFVGPLWLKRAILDHERDHVGYIISTLLPPIIMENYLPQLKGKSQWRYAHFLLNHDGGRKSNYISPIIVDG